MSKTLPKAVQDRLGGAQSLREAELFHRLEAAGFPAFYTQADLIPGRKFRFDFAWGPELKVAVELQGGTHSGGRHTRGKGYETDAVKSALAQSLGWIVLYVTPGQVQSGEAVSLISGALRSRGWEPGREFHYCSIATCGAPGLGTWCSGPLGTAEVGAG